MESPSKTQLKSLELLNYNREQIIKNLAIDPQELAKKKEEIQTNLHSPSPSSGLTYNHKPCQSKVSFDLEEIRQEIKNREYRLVERDREIEEICRLDSSEDQYVPDIRAVIETSSSAPSSTKKDYESEESYRYWICCCKKYCVII
jgi:hypothetical protein